VVSPYSAHPLLYLLLIPHLDSSLRVGIEFVKDFDYLPFWKRSLFHIAALTIALVIARQF
jgi:hypothetical protein